MIVSAAVGRGARLATRLAAARPIAAERIRTLRIRARDAVRQARCAVLGHRHTTTPFVDGRTTIGCERCPLHIPDVDPREPIA